MFDREIVSSDSFTEMSSDAQSLYFHLGLNADDEGFVSPKGIMRMISCPEDALKILTAKKFVIPFESGVVVITDWKNNNWLNSSRIQETKYKKELDLLSIDFSGKYVLSNGLAPARHALGENRIEESSITTKNYTEGDEFELTAPQNDLFLPKTNKHGK